MSESIPLLPQYASMAWCSVKAQGQFYLLPLPSYFNISCVINCLFYNDDYHYQYMKNGQNIQVKINAMWRETELYQMA
jgi:hypothetical protein